MNRDRKRTRLKSSRTISGFTVLLSLLLTLSVINSACLNSPEPSTYYGRVVVPKAQEFRWSDGGLPQTFDPAFAAAPPDTDAVRALFEGLTEYDPENLSPEPAVATRWESSADDRTWTFYLRDNAVWSNGERVTAHDFVRSWKRTLEIGPLAPHTSLLANIAGAFGKAENGKGPVKVEGKQSKIQSFGVEALGDHVLRVRLERGDANFPALVAHPVFRPVKFSEGDRTKRVEAQHLISNGAFLLSRSDSEQVSLEHSKTYWDGKSVALQKVTFINTTNSEDALSAYRAGELDAVTNAPFEPLALKLLTPYQDFRRSTYGALSYYAFNTARAPFDDVRVREALAISIDRERLSQDDLGGATVPANKFLPLEMSHAGSRLVLGQAEVLERDVNKSKQLLAEAGYPEGQGFPVIKLLINRNDQQRIVAQAIAAMWLATLNIQTEIEMKNWDEYELAIKDGKFDVVRRGVVMQTTNDMSNLRMIFERELPDEVPTASPESSPGRTGPIERRNTLVESEQQALAELKAMPIYFASSYSLVKPYVSGFDTNVLDAPVLKRTRLNTEWTMKTP